LGRVLIAKVAPDIQRAVAGARMNGGSVSVGLARGGSVAVENGPVSGTAGAVAGFLLTNFTQGENLC